MASEITEEEDEKYYCIKHKEAERIRIRQLIDYQKSLYASSSASSSFSSAAASTSSFTSPRKSRGSSLLDLMKGGSTSLGRLFDMEHTSLGDYLKDYSVSPIIKPILLWGSDADNDLHDDPWAEIKQIKSAFDSISDFQDGVLSSKENFKDDDIVRPKSQGRKLIRTKSYKRLPRFSLWRCGGCRFKLRIIRKLKIMIRGKIL